MEKKHEKKRKYGEADGFEKWGGYMNAKISKLEAQFDEDQLQSKNQGVSEIFKGISIFVNGYTQPSADELRCLMLQHGGVYHHYYRSGKTTHVIASSLPNAKFNQLKTLKIVKSEWITESIKAGKLLDYKKFLLQNDFPNIGKQENLLLKFAKQEGTKKEDLPKTAADEGYLAEFYNNSRLHYISSLGASLKQYVQEMREKHDGSFPGRTRLQKDMQIFDYEALESNVIMHIDMDCFFVSVALRNYPHLKGKPVAVTHSRGKAPQERDNTDRKFEYNFYKKKIQPKIAGQSSDEESDDEWLKEKSSMSEIASCSYEARKVGVRKGMYLGVALRICPQLKTVPYDFEGYREVSLALYNSVMEYTLDIEAISCDELFIDCGSLLAELKMSPLSFAEVLRKELLEKTSCTSSVGIGSNKLLARLATTHAKPNGQFYLTSDLVEDFMKKLEVVNLPTVGRTTRVKMNSLNVRTCEDLQEIPLNILKKEFGGKTGETLYKYCRGIDDRKVNFSHERKSVSAELNYGIRFNDDEEATTFLKQLSEEVAKRLRDIKMMGRNITFKVMFRAKDAPVETAKFLGHGACDVVNRSAALSAPTDDGGLIAKQVIALYRQLCIPPNELRGIGIHISKLESNKKTLKTIQTYFAAGQQQEATKPDKQRPITTRVALPTASQLDPDVLASLPQDIRLEILKEYGLTDLIPGCSKTDKPDNSPTLVRAHSPMDDGVQQLSELSLSDMRVMIREWVAAESEPLLVDVEMLRMYLSMLVEKKKLETVNIIINSLCRYIRNKQPDSEVWKATYENIVGRVQSSMLSTFGKVLECEQVD